MRRPFPVKANVVAGLCCAVKPTPLPFALFWVLLAPCSVGSDG